MAYVASADRREQFIKAATRVIQKHGVARATTRSIADEAGAPLAALHYCFSTKEELLEQVSATFGRSGLAPAIDNVRPGMGLAAAVEAVLQSTVMYIADNLQTELGELEIAIWAIRKGHPEIPRRIYDAWGKLVQDALAIARTEDEQDQDIAAITRMLADLVDGNAVSNVMTGGGHREESASVASRTIAAAIAAGVFRPS